MSDDTKSPREGTHGLNRRGLFGASTLTRVAALVGASALGNTVTSHEARAAGKDKRSKAEVAPSELGEYYGFWNGGHSGEVRVLGISSIRELMRIPVFNINSTTGWGLTSGSKRVLGDGARFLNGDCRHPRISMTDGKYDDKYLFINGKTNSRVACVRLDATKCDRIVTIPDIQAIHGLRLQKVPYTRYVFCNVELIIPHPNDGLTFGLSGDNAFILYSAIGAETMEVVWQVIVDGNLDNTGMDYSGRFTAPTCYNSEEAVNLDGMMRNERDWVVVFDVPRIEAEIKAEHFVALDNSKMPVVDGRRKDGKDSPATCYTPVPRNPHGLSILPDDKYFITSGKLSPTCTMIAIERLGDLFAGKLTNPCDVMVDEPELGLDPLHATFDSRGNTYTTLFISSQLVRWNLTDAVHAYKGEKADHIRQKLDMQYQPRHNHATLCETSEAGSKWIMVLGKFSKDRFLPTGPLHPGNDQLIDISGKEMKLIHDGPTFAEPRDCILARRDQIKIRRIWDHKDPFFAETVKRTEEDGIDLMEDNKVIHGGNKVHAYMVSMASSLGLIEFKVKQGDGVTMTIANLDRTEDVTRGFVMVNHGIYVEISPQQTSSIAFVANEPGAYWYCCSWFCHALHMKVYRRVLMGKT